MNSDRRKWGASTLRIKTSSFCPPEPISEKARDRSDVKDSIIRDCPFGLVRSSFENSVLHWSMTPEVQPPVRPTSNLSRKIPFLNPIRNLGTKKSQGTGQMYGTRG